MAFRDRADAGRVLAGRLAAFARRPDAVVLALPRGGVPVGYEVARALELPLDVLVVKRLTWPADPRLTLGAVAPGVRVVDRELAHALCLSDETVAEIASVEEDEVARREALYRGSRPPLDVRGRTVLVVDDGVATGSSMRAAVAALGHLGPAHVVVAVPVGSFAVSAELAALVDQTECCFVRNPVYAVGLWYDRYPPVSDSEVCALLEHAAREPWAIPVGQHASSPL